MHLESVQKQLLLIALKSFNLNPNLNLPSYNNRRSIRFNEILESNLNANALPLNRIASTNDINNCILSIN